MTATDAPPVLAIFCGQEHPLDPGTLCAFLISECPVSKGEGTHSFDGHNAWAEPTDPKGT